MMEAKTRYQALNLKRFGGNQLVVEGEGSDVSVIASISEENRLNSNQL